jgi:hypothetical protein
MFYTQASQSRLDGIDWLQLELQCTSTGTNSSQVHQKISKTKLTSKITWEALRNFVDINNMSLVEVFTC